MYTLLCLLALICAVNICLLWKKGNSKVSIILQSITLVCVFTHFIFIDIINFIDNRHAARSEKQIAAQQSSQRSLDAAIKVINLIESNTGKSDHDIICLLGNNPIFFYKLSEQIDGSIYNLSKVFPKEVIKKMRDKNQLLKAIEDSIFAYKKQNDTTRACSLLAAYQRAVKVNAELLARRINHVNDDDELMILFATSREDSTGNTNIIPLVERLKYRYTDFEISEGDLE